AWGWASGVWRWVTATPLRRTIAAALILAGAIAVAAAVGHDLALGAGGVAVGAAWIPAGDGGARLSDDQRGRVADINAILYNYRGALSRWGRDRARRSEQLRALEGDKVADHLGAIVEELAGLPPAGLVTATSVLAAKLRAEVEQLRDADLRRNP